MRCDIGYHCGCGYIVCQAHLCGMMSDLPDHVSTEQEIADAIAELQRWLEELPCPPVMVTLAR